MYGVVNLTIGLAQLLQQRGHEVRYYVGREFRDYIEAHGLKHHLLRYPNCGLPLHTYSVCLNALLATKEFFDGCLESISAYAPDCVVTTFDGLPGIHLAEFLRIPLVIVNPFDLNQRFWNAFWKHNSVEDYYRSITGEQRIGLDGQFRGVSDFLRKNFGYHLPPSLAECIFGGTVEQSATRRIDLIANTRTFLGEYAINTHRRFYVGSMMRAHINGNIPLATRPLVFVSLGTVYGRNQAFFDACAAALHSLDVQVVYSLGNATLQTSHAPGNFSVCAFVSQLEVLKQASAFISHGGTNSIHEMIRYRVPSLVCPQGYDQFINADLLQNHAAALVLRSNEVSPESIRQSVEQLLNGSSALRINLRTLSQDYDNAGGTHRAAGLVEALIDSSIE